MSERELPEINAGSMADIAFLLLIFFLVTTTMNVDSGILRKIPEKQQEANKIIIKDRNILEVNINRKNELFVDNQIISISQLKEIATNFIDNGSGFDINNQPCTWCNGKKLPNYSDHPTKAFIVLQADRKTSYAMYVSVLDQINSAYTLLRNRLSIKMYGISYTKLLIKHKKQSKNKEALQKKIKLIREKYPLLVSESEIEK